MLHITDYEELLHYFCFFDKQKKKEEKKRKEKLQELRLAHLIQIK
jgi:hypothetical protein